MGRTTIGTKLVRDGSVRKEDIDILTVGQALITDVKAGNGIELTSTGADEGTGSVEITNAVLGTRVTFNYNSDVLIYENDLFYFGWLGSDRQFVFLNKTTGRHMYQVYTMYDTTRKRRARDLNLNSTLQYVYLSNNGNPQNSWGWPASADNGHTRFSIAKENDPSGVIMGEAMRHGNFVSCLVWKAS